MDEICRKSFISPSEAYEHVCQFEQTPQFEKSLRQWVPLLLEKEKNKSGLYARHIMENGNCQPRTNASDYSVN